MTPGSVFCADIGSSSLKAALIDYDGRELGFVRRPYDRERKETLAGDWEEALAAAAGLLLSRAGAVKPGAICISGNGPTLVPVTASGEALAPVHWYNPASPAAENETARRSLFLPYAAALMQKRPGDYAAAKYLFSSQEWLAHRLGADPVTVLPAPAYEPYYWDTVQCGALGIDPGKFPPFARLGTVIGRLSSAGAGRLALPPGIPIIAGGPDFIMALIGVGALEAGVVCDRAGSSEGINICVQGKAPAPAGSLRVLPHLREGCWNVGALIPGSGRFFEWYCSLILNSPDLKSAGTALTGAGYETIMRRINAVPQDAAPFFFPPAGLIFSGVPPEPAELGRAVAEAIAFRVCSALEDLALGGFPVGEMRLSGGQGKSRIWNQLKADITGVTLLSPEIADGELAGDAAAAALGMGEAADLPEAVSRMVRIRERFVPGPAHGLYQERYRRYRILSEQIGKLVP
ncbi:MAG: FGGY-family carbohydrate kinase [Treponema sp.]|jgi:xylulokinase|nr:FGGY-family carbohydrate kinase [Treponema sp.]